MKIDRFVTMANKSECLGQLNIAELHGHIYCLIITWKKG